MSSAQHCITQTNKNAKTSFICVSAALWTKPCAALTLTRLVLALSFVLSIVDWKLVLHQHNLNWSWQFCLCWWSCGLKTKAGCGESLHKWLCVCNQRLCIWWHAYQWLSSWQTAIDNNSASVGENQLLTCTGIIKMSTARATKEEGPSWMYSITIAPMILNGDDMTPRMFWNNICRVSASVVTRLKIRPLLNWALAEGVRYSTLSKTSCTSIALNRNPASHELRCLLSADSAWWVSAQSTSAQKACNSIFRAGSHTVEQMAKTRAKHSETTANGAQA